MSSEPDKRQLKVEADRYISLEKEMHGRENQAENFRVEQYTAEDYLPNCDLKKIMTVKLYDELCGILDDVRSLNEEHAGEPVIEVNVYFSLTRVHRSLEDRLLSWSKSFLEQRVKKDNPKDNGDAFLKYDHLLREYYGIFRDKRRAIDYLCFGMCKKYAASFIFEHTWKKELRIEYNGDYHIDISSPERFPDQYVRKQIEKYRFGLNDLALFIRQVTASGVPDPLAKMAKIPRETLLKGIGRSIDLICLMRPFLVKNFHPEKAFLRVSDSLFVTVDWCAHEGIMNLYVARTERDLLENVRFQHSGLQVTLGLDGLLIDRSQSWISIKQLEPIVEVGNLAVNAYILGLIEERLFGLMERFDFSRIRRPKEGDPISQEDEDVELALSCQRLATTDSSEDTSQDLSCQDLAVSDASGPQSDDDRPSRSAGKRLRPLRLPTLLKVLEKKLSCEVRPGRGDETVVFRTGGKSYRIGRPSQIHPVFLKRVLHRLGIPIEEWLAAVG